MKASDGEKGGPNSRGSKGDETISSQATNWPTPTTAPEAKNLGSNQRTGEPSLGGAASSWPTPTAALGVQGADTPGLREGQVTLTGMVGLWPTPTSRTEDGGERVLSDESLARRLSSQTRDTGSQIQLTLETVASKLWPTAGTNDHKGASRPGQRRGQLDEAAEQKNLRCSRPAPAASGTPSSSTPPGSPPLWKTPHGIGNQGATGNIGGGSPFSDQVAKVTGKKRLNPYFVEWLMGFPTGWFSLGWTDSAAWETQWSRWLARMRTAYSKLPLVAKWGLDR